MLFGCPGRQVREAYRKRGWGFNNPAGIVQCENEGFLKKLKVQAL